jgi:cell division septation protein DedD
VTELHDGADEGFHEIQLSGKQLVFLFMATTVISVVIFLCGVLVGRGVRGDTVTAAEATTASAQPSPSGAAPPVDAPPPVDPPAGTGDVVSYPKRLESTRPVAEELKTTPAAKSEPPAAPAERLQPKPADAVPPPTAPPGPASAPLPASPPAATPASTPASITKPAGNMVAPGARAGAWAVQVVALSDRSAANAVVQRLSGKGYPAFVLSPQAGAAVQHYKVQVGRYPDRSEAEKIKTRLKKEEQFEPIIVR